VRVGHRGIARSTAALALIVSLSQPAGAAQQRTVPLFSVTAGEGNSLGWAGLQAERYVKDGRVSIFLGLGYVPSSSEDPNLPSGVAGAGGFRVFSGGRRHRAFVEASVSEVAREWSAGAGSSIQQSHLYGPGAQLGYQLILNNGFTVAASLGAGYAVSAQTEHVHLLAGISLGYTRRRP
jgi:hypothetical protein